MPIDIDVFRIRKYIKNFSLKLIWRYSDTFRPEGVVLNSACTQTNNIQGKQNWEGPPFTPQYVIFEHIPIL